MATSRQCEQCSGDVSGFARTSVRYCSGACKQKAYRARKKTAIPADLRERDRWVSWMPVTRAGVATKLPIRVKGRGAASSTDKSTWSSFAEVEGKARKGFVLNGDGIVCLDFDHCLDAQGQVLPWAAKIIGSLPETYVEVSPSGDGLHVWGFGEVARGRRLKVPGGFVEIYGTGRYITVTGNRFGSCVSLASLSAVITSLL